MSIAGRVLLSAWAVLSLLGTGILPAAVPPVRPNVVLIVADDLGYGDIGPFGSRLNRTPHLDRLAREGMKLTSFYGCPVCTPSRAQFMTGCYAKRVSLPTVIFPACPIGLNTNELTLPKLLKQQGYATMAIGKWHLGDQREFLPTRLGFDHYFGLPYSNDMGGGEEGPALKKSQRSGAKGIANGVATALGVTGGRRPPLPLVRDELVIETVSPAQQDRLTERYTTEAVQFIRMNQGHPFFLYFPPTAVHVPLHPGRSFQGQSANGTYGDWVEELDWSIGRVMETLRELQLDSRTLVIFTSDNGPWLVQGDKGGVAGPLRGGKGSTWEGGMREPTIAWWPGLIPAGQSCDAVCANIDLLPTLVKLAGGQVPVDRPIDGRDIWPLLSGASQESPREAHYYFNGNRLEAVRVGPWKLAINPQAEGPRGGRATAEGQTKAPRLYDLVSDIGETNDVSAQHPDVIAQLQGLVARMETDLGTNRLGPGVRPPGRVAHPQALLRPGTKYEMTSAPVAIPGKSLAELRPGEILERDSAPQVAHVPFTVSVVVTPQSSQGVILAHGGSATGYALHLRNGQLVFTVREKSVPVTATTTRLPAGQVAIEAQLGADGAMTVRVNGQAVASAKAAGLLPAQPQENFCLGFDDGQPVGDYPAGARYSGKIERLSVTTIP
jgi:arylsulfatase A